MQKTLHVVSTNGRNYNLLGLTGANIFKMEVVNRVGADAERKYKDKKNVYGISHLIEHLGFRQPRDYTTPELIETMKTFGRHNASTCHEEINYWFMTTSTNHELAINLVCNYAFNDLTKVPQKEFDAEKDVVLNEIRRYADDDQTMFQFSQTISLFGFDADDNILGTVDTVGAVTLEDVVEFKREMLIDYHPTINVVYDPKTLSVQQIVEKIEKEISGFLPISTTATPREMHNFMPGAMVVDNPSEQSLISLIMKHNIKPFTIGMALRYLSSMAKGTSLDDVIREKHGLTYGITCYNDRLYNNKVAVIGADVAAGNEQLFVDLVASSINDSANNFTTDAHKRLLDSTELVNTLDTNVMKHCKWFSIIKHDGDFYNSALKDKAEQDLDIALTAYETDRLTFDGIESAINEVRTVVNLGDYARLSNVAF